MFLDNIINTDKSIWQSAEQLGKMVSGEECAYFYGFHTEKLLHGHARSMIAAALMITAQYRIPQLVRIRCGEKSYASQVAYPVSIN